MPLLAERAVDLESGDLWLWRALFLPCWMSHLVNMGAVSNNLIALCSGLVEILPSLSLHCKETNGAFSVVFAID